MTPFWANIFVGFALGVLLCSVGEMIGKTLGEPMIGFGVTMGLFYACVFVCVWFRLSGEEP